MIRLMLKTIVDNSLVKIYRYLRLASDHEAGIYKHNLHSLLWERATAESVDYVEQYVADVLVFQSREQLFDYCVYLLRKADGKVCLEFGVFKGESINYLSERLPEVNFYGFDSFKGLAEDWTGHHLRQGHFDLRGAMPRVNANVELVEGWFEESVPAFLKSHSDLRTVALVHIDGDTYAAARAVFENIGTLVKPGLLILFDEYLGYPNWRHGEYLAWQQFCAAQDVQFRYRAFSNRQALVEII